MGQTDWNWFFSTMAQSSAAIVGVISAFLISNILANQSDFNKNIAEIKSLVADGNRLKKLAAIRYFEWYNSRVYILEFKKIIKKIYENQHVDAEKLYWDANFSVYQDVDEVIRGIVERINSIKIEIEYSESQKQKDLEANIGNKFYSSKPHLSLRADKEFARSINALTDEFFEVLAENKTLHMSSVGDADLIAKIENESDEIKRLYVECDHHSKIVNLKLESVRGNPQSSTLVNSLIILVAVLFYAGVILPIYFLPMAIDSVPTLAKPSFDDVWSVKNFFVSCISIIFGALVFILIDINKSLNFKKSLLLSLGEFNDVSKYSKYFGLRVDYYFREAVYLNSLRNSPVQQTIN